MLLWTFVFGGVFFLGVSIIFAEHLGGLAVVGVLMLLVALIMGPVNITGYADVVAKYRNADDKIALAEAEYEILSGELGVISKTKMQSALLNADTPYASLIHARTRLRKDLLEYKTTKVWYKQEIDAYRLGVFSFVTRFVDDEGIE